MNRLMLLVFALWSSTAFGVPSTADLDAYKEAGARLLMLIEAAENKKDIKQLKTPEVMGLVSHISDESKVLRTDQYAASEIETLSDICDVANRVSKSLIRFDLKANLDPRANQQQIQALQIAQMNSNSLIFQDELKDIQSFLLRCLAKEISAASLFVASFKPEEFTDVRRQGLAQMRLGLSMVYTGAVQSATDTRYSDEFRLSLLAALAESSDSFASVTELTVRRQLHAMVVAAATKAEGQYKHHLERIAGSFSGQTCELLCSIH